MKKIICISIIFSACFFLVKDLFIKNNTNQNTNNNFKIIANFEKGVVEDKTLFSTMDVVQNRNIKELFIRFDVDKVKAVYTNRYDENGFLKPDIKSSIPGTWQQIIISDIDKAEKLVTKLKEENGVIAAYIEKPVEIKPCIAPTDSEYGNQWHLNSTSFPMADIDAEQAWDIQTGRSDVIISVCDGGIDYTHPDLDPGDRSRVIAGYDFGSGDNDPMDDLATGDSRYGGHATHIAGIIGAIPNNGQVAGVMWNCKIMPVKMVGGGSLTISYPFGAYNWDFSTTAFPSDAADAIDYSVNNGAHVINLSYGFPDMGFPINDVILRVPLLYNAILNAYNNNVVVVAAMGNDYQNGNPTQYPAAFPEVIAVGNTEENPLDRWQSSSTGSHISVSAPGKDILSTVRGGSTGTKTGTSMAAPVVAGVSGLIISQGMDRGFSITNDDVRQIIERTAVDIGSSGFDNETGHGIVNAHNALSLLDDPNELYHYNSVGGTSAKVQDLSQWILISGRWGLAAGTYYNVDQYKITKHVTFDVPFCSIPEVWMRDKESKCLSYGNPNSGRPYCIITNVTTTGFDLEYVVYYVPTNTLGQTINKWIPASPSASNVAYTVVGEPYLAGAAGPLTGASIICSSGSTYEVENLLQGATVTWSTSSNITRTSSQGSNPCNFVGNGSGSGWLEAYVSVPGGCGNYTLPRKNVWVGPPDQYKLDIIIDGGSILANDYVSAEADYNDYPGVLEFDWDLINAVDWEITEESSAGPDNKFVEIEYWEDPYPDYEDVSIRAKNSCGWSYFHTETFSVDGGYYMMMSPNPSSGATTVSIESGTEEPALKSALTTSKIDENVEWDLEIYDAMQSLKQKKTKLKGKSTTINTQSWKEGVYMVRAKYKGKMLTGKLVVKE